MFVGFVVGHDVRIYIIYIILYIIKCFFLNSAFFPKSKNKNEVIKDKTQEENELKR